MWRFRRRSHDDFRPRDALWFDELRQDVRNVSRRPRTGGDGTARADAGRSQQEAAIRLARWVGVVVAVLPIAFALILWLPGRLRWIRASQVASALRGDTALFAVRAIANRPVRELAAIDPAPGSALLRGDARVIEALAALELGAMGVKRPAEAG